MRVIIQRVQSSSVTVDGEILGKIGRGLNLLVGIAGTDTDTELDWMTRKCLELRIFPGESDNNRWEKSVTDIQGEILVVSQFTLYGDCRKGRRPSFSGSASPEIAEMLFDRFVDKLKQSGLHIATGKLTPIVCISVDRKQI